MTVNQALIKLYSINAPLIASYRWGVREPAWQIGDEPVTSLVANTLIRDHFVRYLKRVRRQETLVTKMNIYVVTPAGSQVARELIRKAAEIGKRI